MAQHRIAFWKQQFEIRTSRSEFKGIRRSGGKRRYIEHPDPQP